MKPLEVVLIVMMLRSVHERIMPAGGSSSVCVCVLE